MLLQAPDARSPDVKLLVSAINTLARASGCAPDDLPADPALLREHLARISPAMARLTKGSWASIRSRILKAMQRADVQVMAGRRTRPLSEQWGTLYKQVPENGWQASLSRFVGYLSDNNVSPHDVSDGWVERFSRELETSSLRGRPAAIVRGAVRGWNAASKRVAGWPPTGLTVPAAEKTGYVLRVESFPASFQNALADYLSFLADPPEDDDAPPKALRPITVKLREFQLRQIASALVHKGTPSDDIVSVAMLTERVHINTVCDFFIERSGGRADCSQLQGLLAALRSIALHVRRERQVADWISRRRRRLGGDRPRVGMTEKNRRRLAVFRDPRQVRDLLLLPYRLLKRAQDGSLPAKPTARLVRTAVAIELEIMCPIRLKNLSEINVDTDLVRSHARPGAPTHLFIPGSRTKNGEDIELELPKSSVALLDLYVMKYRNVLIEPDHRGHAPRFLFPKPDGTAKDGKVLASGICDVLLRELGIEFNMHLFRHLGCFLYLKRHPGQIDVMRRVLGHKDGATTMRFYAFIEQSDAFRLFDTHVLQIREEALRPRGKTSAVSRTSSAKRARAK
ncbi:hypothetical protein [Lichenicoccus sp.]|uniref:hypothetical protein n=1 Tax=Lichenicoccus sp. TaxID=2781899 RepID=UPI003D1049D2